MLAIVIHSSDKIAGAEEYYKRAASMFERALAQQWDENWQTRRIEALDFLGDLYGLEGYANLGRTKDALAAYTRARDLSAELVQRNPNSREALETLFLMQLSVAGVEHRLGHVAAAEKGYRDAIAVNEPMVRGASSPSEHQNLAAAYSDLANQLTESERPQEALPYAQRAYDMIREIAGADPRNSLYQRSLAARELWLGNIIRLTGDPVKAQKYFREALASMEKLNAADPRSGEKRSDMAAALHQLGEAQLAAGDPRTALTQERKALATLRDMPEQSQDENLRKQIVHSSITAGEAELALGHKKEAIADFQTAADIADKMVHDDPDQAYDRLDRVRAQSHLARAMAMNGQCSQAESVFQQTSAEWKSLQEIGILGPTELRKSTLSKLQCRSAAAFDSSD